MKFEFFLVTYLCTHWRGAWGEWKRETLQTCVTGLFLSVRVLWAMAECVAAHKAQRMMYNLWKALFPFRKERIIISRKFWNCLLFNIQHFRARLEMGVSNVL